MLDGFCCRMKFNRLNVPSICWVAHWLMWPLYSHSALKDSERQWSLRKWAPLLTGSPGDLGSQQKGLWATKGDYILLKPYLGLSIFPNSKYHRPLIPFTYPFSHSIVFSEFLHSPVGIIEISCELELPWSFLAAFSTKWWLLDRCSQLARWPRCIPQNPRIPSQAWQ